LSVEEGFEAMEDILYWDREKQKIRKKTKKKNKNKPNEPKHMTDWIKFNLSFGCASCYVINGHIFVQPV
jgi:hypothetical protein